MMLPSLFGENLFDNFWEDFSFPDMERRLYGKPANSIMKTDVKEIDGSYEVDIDLPGFKKDEIKMQLKDGYLTVHAAKQTEQNQKDENGSYIRRERYVGSMSRSFYVGDHVKEEEIHARYEDGILSFRLPKEEQKAVEEKEHFISIEG